jgi:hypothetical protein
MSRNSHAALMTKPQKVLHVNGGGKVDHMGGSIVGLRLS